MTTNEKKPLPANAFTTDPVRLAFPSLFEPRAKIEGSTELVYQCSALLPPTTNRDSFVGIIKAAWSEKFGTKPIKLSQPDGMPLRECKDKDTYADFPDWHYFNARSKFMPLVVDQARRPILDVLPPNASAEEKAAAIERAKARIFAGCWVRMNVSAFAWEFKGKFGVSFSLNAVQLIREDARLDGRRSAEQLFDAVEGGDDLGTAAGAPKSTLDDLLG